MNRAIYLSILIGIFSLAIALPVFAEGHEEGSCETGISTALTSATTGLDRETPQGKAMHRALEFLERPLGHARVTLVAVENFGDNEDYKDLSTRIQFLIDNATNRNSVFLKGADTKVTGMKIPSHGPFPSSELALMSPNFVTLFTRQLMGDPGAIGHIEALKAVVSARVPFKPETGASKRRVISFDLSMSTLDHPMYYGGLARLSDANTVMVETKFLRAFENLAAEWEKEGLWVQFLVRGRLTLEQNEEWTHFGGFHPGPQSFPMPAATEVFPSREVRLLKLNGDLTNILLVPNAQLGPLK